VGIGLRPTFLPIDTPFQSLTDLATITSSIGAKVFSHRPSIASVPTLLAHNTQPPPHLRRASATSTPSLTTIPQPARVQPTRQGRRAIPRAEPDDHSALPARPLPHRRPLRSGSVSVASTSMPAGCVTLRVVRTPLPRATETPPPNHVVGANAGCLDPTGHDVGRSGSSGRAAPWYAPEDPSLPKLWRGLVDGITGYLYYWNPDTNVTQHERPAAAPLPLMGPWVPDQAYFEDLFARLNAISMALSSSTQAPAAWSSSPAPTPTSSWAAMPTSSVAPSGPSSSPVAWLTTLGATIPGPVYQPLAPTLDVATMSTTAAPPPLHLRQQR
jgi:hypothetical protein